MCRVCVKWVSSVSCVCRVCSSGCRVSQVCVEGKSSLCRVCHVCVECVNFVSRVLSVCPVCQMCVECVKCVLCVK